MITFIGSIILLMAGYFVYGKVIDKIFVIDDRNETPAYANYDGFDYVPMPWWKASLIQLLYRWARTDFWGDYGCSLWSGCFYMDRFWSDFCRRSSRLLFRYDVTET